MTLAPRLERLADGTAVQWLDRVGPQLGRNADFAQVDVDTLIPLSGAVKKNLALFSVALFEVVARSALVEERGWFVELSIPIHGAPPELEVAPQTDVQDLLPFAQFAGNLRGWSVPGLFLSTWIPSDRRGPERQSRVRLRSGDAPTHVIHFRDEQFAESIGGGESDVWTERAIEYRRYPSEPTFSEAVYP
jgi:hypothetical protein